MVENSFDLVLWYLFQIRSTSSDYNVQIWFILYEPSQRYFPTQMESSDKTQQLRIK